MPYIYISGPIIEWLIVRLYKKRNFCKKDSARINKASNFENENFSPLKKSLCTVLSLATSIGTAPPGYKDNRKF